MNTMFRYNGVHMCTWHQDTLGCSSMINFVDRISGRRLRLFSPECPGHSGEERGRAFNRPPTGGELPLVAGEEANET